MRAHSISYTEPQYDDTVCFQCHAKLSPEPESYGDLSDDGAYFRFNGFCGAACAVRLIANDITKRGFDPEFIRRATGVKP